MKLLFQLIGFSLVVWILLKPLEIKAASPSFSLDYLQARQQRWPDWQFPRSFSASNGLQEDLIYPEWFLGTWKVQGINTDDSANQNIQHLARFKTNENHKIVSDRAFNAKSIGRSVLGERLLNVKDDPYSPNRQLTILKDNQYLETSNIFRMQESNKDGVLYTDEVALQIFYGARFIRISRVETLTEYKQCQLTLTSNQPILYEGICADQWQAVYKAPGEEFSSKPFKTSHYYLELMPLK